MNLSEVVNGLSNYDPLDDAQKDEIIKRDQKNHEEGKDDSTSKRARSEDEGTLDEHTKKRSRIEDPYRVEKKLRDEEREQHAEDLASSRDQREPEKDTRRIEEPADMAMEEEDTEETIRAKVQQVLDNEVVELNQPSSNKRCLVLDIDYTIFDQHGTKDPNHQEEYTRPYLHEFLTTLYEHYDLVIFSATSQEAIEKKLENMGVLTHEKYKICLSLNRSHMIHISKKIGDKIVTERAKPLKIIWKKFEGYGPHNTIHIDDKAPNFQLNPSNGLLIEPYKDATDDADKELFYLTQYLLLIARHEDDFSQLAHNKWKEYVIDRLYEKQKAIQIPPHPIDVEQDKSTQQS